MKLLCEDDPSLCPTVIERALKVKKSMCLFACLLGFVHKVYLVQYLQYICYRETNGDVSSTIMLCLYLHISKKTTKLLGV